MLYIQQMVPRHIDLTSDLDVLFGTIDGEAEDQPVDGWIAVGSSVANRAATAATRPHLFGDGSIKGACLMPEQYDCWSPGKDHDRIMALDLDNLSYTQQQIMHTTQQILSKQVSDPTFGATYYYAKQIPAPSWVSGAFFCGLFGSQLFWKGVK